MKKILSKFLALVLAVSMTAGCASGMGDYYSTSRALSNDNAKVQLAEKETDNKAVEGLTAIATSPNTSPEQKGAAVMAIALRNANKAGQSQPMQVQAPGPEPWMQVLQTFAPVIGNLGMTVINAGVSKTQSRNATELGVAQINGFVGIAGKIQAPMAPAANVTTNTTTTTDNSARTRTDNSQRDSGNTTTTSTWGANSGANSGNAGRLAGTSMTDNTSTPTVVMQPAPAAPVIVNPVVVNPVIVQP